MFSRGTPLAPLPSLWFSTPWSRGFRGRFLVFSSMGGTWTMALYVAPLRILEEDGPCRRLHLKHSKSLLFLPPNLTDPSCPLPQDIPTTSEGFVLFGAPIGPSEFCRSVVRERIENIGDSVKLLFLLEDSQSEYSLLRFCLSLPKLLCALRTTSPDILLPVISEFDSHL